MRRGFLRELRNIAFIGIEPTVLCFFATNGCEGWCDLSFTAKCIDHLVQVKIQLGYAHQWFHMGLGLWVISHSFEISLASPLITLKGIPPDKQLGLCHAARTGDQAGSLSFHFQAMIQMYSILTCPNSRSSRVMVPRNSGESCRVFKQGSR